MLLFFLLRVVYHKDTYSWRLLNSIVSIINILDYHVGTQNMVTFLFIIMVDDKASYETKTEPTINTRSIIMFD